MKKQIRKILSCTIILSLLTACITSCKKDEEAVATEKAQFNQTGLPIVNEPVTLNATVCRPSIYGKWDEMSFYKNLEEQTGVHIEWTEVYEPYAERINLIFASRDYPDFMFRGATDTQISNAAAAGDVVELTPLIDQYAPNWKKLLDDNSYIKKTISDSNGNIYGLPFVRMDEADYGIRDIWLINNDWLKKLGLEIPQTLDEFYNVLKAFKEEEGKKLPEGITPWYLRFNQNVGGHFDLFSSFGLVECSNHIMVEDGKVKFTANTEEAKEVVKFLNKLYKENLIPTEMFTDDFATYVSKLNSDPATVGVISTYNHPFVDEHTFVPMLVPKGPGVDKALMRKQTSMIARNNAVIFSSNKNPELTMRWLDELAKPENSIQLLYGTLGETITKKDNGRYGFIEGPNVPAASQTASGNFGPAAITEDVIDMIDFSGQEAIRRKYYNDLYKDNTVPLETMYPNVYFTDEQQEIRSQYTNDINSYIEKQFADFIVNGNIDEGWNSYLEGLDKLGLDKLMAVYQEGLDAFNKN